MEILRPFLRDGFAVSFRTVCMVGLVMASSSIIARVDAMTQAAHEIIRQMWILLYQGVECINISNQALASTALGTNDTSYAVAVVQRHLVYAISITAIAGAVVLTFREQVVSIFTSDSSVIATALTTLPLLVFAFPLDAITAILDGTLTAAGCDLNT
jgi:Na+-driven multidrug efflux pump